MIDVDDTLREFAREWRARQPPVHVDFDASTTRDSRGRRPAAIVLVAVAVVAAITSAAVVVAGLDSGHRRSAPPVPATRTQAPRPAGAARVIKIIDLGQEAQYPAAVAVTPGFVSVLALPAGRDREWVSSFSTGTDAFPVTMVRLPDDGPIALVGDARALWVSSQLGEQSAHVFRIEHGAISATLPTQGDAALALTGSTLWVLDGKGALLRVDPTSATVKTRLSLPGGGYAPKFVSAGPLGVWLSSPYDGSIWRAAADDRTVRRVTTVGTYAGELTQLARRVWVATEHGITAIDPTTGHATLAIELHRRVDAVTNDGRSVWVATDGPRLYRIDPATGAARSVALPAAGPILGLAGDPATRSVWAVTAGTQSGNDPCINDCPKLLHIGS